MDLQEIGRGGMDLIDLAHGTLLQVVFILFVSCMSIIVFDFVSIFILDSPFLDWKPGCRGGCVTSGGRGAGHRICDTRWPESKTCNII
jgi:hypothetical protein